MKNGIIRLGVVSCKAEPSHKAEQINQLLFGETYSIEEEEEDWIKIKTAFDNYVAWIDRKNHTFLSEEHFNTFTYGNASLVLNLIDSVQDKTDNTAINVPIGSSIYKKDQDFKHDGNYSSKNIHDLHSYAFKFLNTPYLWGGRTPLGIDCSGFVQMTYKLCGIKLPRDSYQQAEIGQTIDNLEEVKLGDLCFFGSEQRIDHVGLFLDTKNVIHASGKVKVDAIDSKGIWLEKEQKYSHFLKKIQRIF